MALTNSVGCTFQLWKHYDEACIVSTFPDNIQFIIVNASNGKYLLDIKDVTGNEEIADVIKKGIVERDPFGGKTIVCFFLESIGASPRDAFYFLRIDFRNIFQFRILKFLNFDN